MKKIAEFLRAGIFQIARPMCQCGKLIGEPRYVDAVIEMCDRAVREPRIPVAALLFDDRREGRWRPNAWWPFCSTVPSSMATPVTLCSKWPTNTKDWRGG